MKKTWSNCHYYLKPDNCPHINEGIMQDCINAMIMEGITGPMVRDYQIPEEPKCDQANEIFCNNCDKFKAIKTVEDFES